MTTPIDASALRVGMFVHLNVGWMSHPFPLSSFKITSAEQIDTIRSLGLNKITWSPERSDADPETDVRPDPLQAPLAASAETADAGADASAAAPQEPAPADPKALARQALALQREVAQRCERQFNEACRDLRKTTDKVLTDAAAAREDAQSLARAMLEKMLADGEPCLRVLGEMAGDRAAAHSLNVTVISLLLARQMNVAAQAMQELGVGALMHDVGKLALPDRVRLPRDDFNSSEAALYRDHVAQGLILARRMGLSADAQLVIAQHHEHADGSGFPSALMLPRMSMGARIVALVNRYDNLCNASTPALSITPHEALSKLFSQCRTKYDETLLSGFIKMMGIYPPGSVVQLSDERYAMVMTVNATHPLKPRVMVYDPGTPSADALFLDLEGYPLLGIRRSLKPSQLPPRVADYLKPRQRIAYYFDVEDTVRDEAREEVPA
jgi:putative nucleotidyltransferase with HDIG domain